MQILIVGGFSYGFRFYGPFPLDLADPAAIEEGHKDERDHREGFARWEILETPGSMSDADHIGHFSDEELMEELYLEDLRKKIDTPAPTTPTSKKKQQHGHG